MSESIANGHYEKALLIAEMRIVPPPASKAYADVSIRQHTSAYVSIEVQIVPLQTCCTLELRMLRYEKQKPKLQSSRKAFPLRSTTQAQGTRKKLAGH